MLSPAKKTKVSLSAEAKKEERAAWLFLLPMLIGLLIFFVYPFFQNLYDSLFYGKNLMSPKFVGLKNYRDLFQDEHFIRAILNTFGYVLITVPCIVIIALLLAILLNRPVKGRGFYRTLIFFPLVTTSAAIAMVWRWIMNTQYGIANAAIEALGGQPVGWLTDENIVFWSCCIVIVWASVSYETIILLAGLQNIPHTYYEAAEIDGASSVQKFFSITLPLLSPTLYFVITVVTIAMFKQFEIVYMLIPAGIYNSITPQIEASRSIVRYFYDIAFRDNIFGYPSAVTIALFVIILIVTLLQNVIQKKWVYNE